MKQEQGILQVELEEHTKADYDFINTVSATFSIAKRTREIFDSSEIDEKRQILNYLLQNPSVQGKKLCFTIASPFNLVLELSDSPDLLRLVNDVRTSVVGNMS